MIHADKPENLLKTEAAEFLRISKRTLDYLIAAKEIPFVRVSKKGIRFRRSSLEKWMNQREQGNQ